MHNLCTIHALVRYIYKVYYDIEKVELNITFCWDILLDVLFYFTNERLKRNLERSIE